MKTVKGLRTAIANCDGELKIGSITFSRKDEGDIDIHVQDNLLAWISSSVEDDKRLDEVYMTVNSDVLADPNQASVRNERDKFESRVEELEDEKHNLENSLQTAEQTIEELKESSREDRVKVATYERLFDREITLKSGN